MRISTLSLFIFLFFMSFNLSAQKQHFAHPKEYVVVLHGIFFDSKHMKKLVNYLEKEGYEVININYPSTKQTLEELTKTITTEVQGKLIEDKPVHFVGYSMGGLIIRAMLTQYQPKQLGKVVLLATPNHGSEVADFLQKSWLYQKFYGPAGQQLITDQTRIAPLFGDIDYPLGVIAGNGSYNPVSSYIIPGDDDGTVSVESTKIEGMTDHIVLKGNHTFFPNYKQVQIQTVYFLRKGKFFHKGN